MKPPCPKCAAADLPQDKCPHLSKRDPDNSAMMAFLLETEDTPTDERHRPADKPPNP